MKTSTSFLFLFFVVFVSTPPSVWGQEQEQQEEVAEDDDEALVWGQEFDDDYADNNDEAEGDSNTTTAIQSIVANDTFQNDESQNDASQNKPTTTVSIVENSRGSNKTNSNNTAYSCSLLGFLPFSSPDLNYRSYQLPQYGMSTISGGSNSIQTTITDEPYAPPYAVTHAAAALMAVDHFNARQSVLVPELTNYTSNCNVAIDGLVVRNTDSREGQAPRLMLDYFKEHGTPCGVVGDYTNIPTKEVGIVANGMDTVVVSHGADDAWLTSPRNPGTTRTVADQHPNGEAIVSWLRSKQRTEFLSILYTSHAHGLAYADTLRNAAQETGFQYLLREVIAPPYVGTGPGMVRYALQKIADSSYKTIVVAINKYLGAQLPLIADFAEELKLNTPEYVWVFVLPIEQTLDEFVVYSTMTENNPNITKLVNGSAVVRNLDAATLSDTPFQTLWKLQDDAFVDRLNDILPSKYAVPEDYFRQYKPEAGAGYIYDAVIAIGMGKCQELKRAASVGGGKGKGGPGGKEENGQGGGSGEENGQGGGGGNGQGSGGGGNGQGSGGGQGQGQRELSVGVSSSRSNRYLNDSIDADRRRRRAKRAPPRREQRRKLQKKEELLSPHMEGITGLDFHGVTGRHLWNESRRKRNRSRKYMAWGVYNIRAINPREKELMEARFPDHNFTLWYYLTDILEGGPVDGEWKMTEEGPFLFSDGTPDPPKLLRDPPEQNYLSLGARIVGLTLMSISLLLTLLVTFLVFTYEAQSIIHHNQPFFLYVILLGTALLAFSIFFLSFDEAALSVAPEDPEPEFLDTACMTLPWFLSLGYSLIYVALFMKLWRINRVLQCSRVRRKSIGVKQVIWPCILLTTACVTVLTVWMAVDPFQWERTPIDPDEPQGESYGQCSSSYDTIFICILGAVTSTPLWMSMLMAYKTKDVDSRFSESRWAFMTIVFQFQILVVGIPILIIVKQKSKDATYMCSVLLIWTVSMSTVILMFGPKLVPILFPDFVERWNRTTLRSSIGDRGNVTVSGRNTHHVNGHNTKSTQSSVNGPTSRGMSGTHPDMSASYNTDHYTQPTISGTIYSNDDNFSGIPPTSAHKDYHCIDHNGIETKTKDDNDYTGIPPNSLENGDRIQGAQSSNEVVFSTSTSTSMQLHDSTCNPGAGFLHPDMDNSMIFQRDGDDGDYDEEKPLDPADSTVLELSMNFETAVEFEEELPAPTRTAIQDKHETTTTPATSTREKRTSKYDSQSTIKHKN